MPVIREKARLWKAKRPRESLIAQLCAELRGEDTPPPRPYIFQSELSRLSRRRVIVIWDEWKDLSPADRTEAILEAYERHDREGHAEPPIAPTLGLILGATYLDAMRLELLPYDISPTEIIPPGWDAAQSSRIEDAMRHHGAIETGRGPALCFPSREMRDQVFERLIEATPEGCWHKYDPPEDGATR